MLLALVAISTPALLALGIFLFYRDSATTRVRLLRSQIEAIRVVADLDRLIAEPIGVRFDGKTHIIKPVTTGEFLKIYQAMAELDSLRTSDKIEKDKLIEAYHGLFSSVCDTIDKKTLLQMTQPQVAALFQIVLDHIGAKAHVNAEKKNTLKPPNTL